MFTKIHVTIYSILLLALLAVGSVSYLQYRDGQRKAAEIATLENQVATQKKVLEFNVAEQEKLQSRLTKIASELSRAEHTARVLRNLPAPSVGERDGSIDRIGKALEGLTK